MRIPEFVTIAAQAVAASIDLITFEGQALRVRAADVLAVQDLPALPKSLVWPGSRSMVFFGSHVLIVRGSKQAIDTAVDGALSPGAPAAAVAASYVLIEDQRPSGTEGGTHTAGSWQTRVLNTIVSDADSMVASLTANQVELLPGDWLIRLLTPGKAIGFHQCRLQDLTAGAPGTELKSGTSESSSGSIQTSSFLTHRMSFAANKKFEAQHRGSATVATIGFGQDATLTTEVYSRFEAWRLGDA